MVTFDTYEIYENITEILHDIYIGDIEENDIIDFIVFLENNDEESFHIFNEFLKIINSLNNLGINSHDFTNTGNIGFDNNSLIYFDIGFGDYYANTDKFNIPKIGVDENNKFWDILNLDYISILGNGGNGEAYELTDGRVLKITKDNSEAYNSCILLNNKDNEPKNLIKIHYVAELYLSEFPDLDIQKQYIIIQDKVATDEGKIKQIYKSININYELFKKQIL